MRFDNKIRLDNARVAGIQTLLFSFLYAFMSWLFFFTKPSFMDLLNFAEKIGVLFTTGLSIALLGLFFLGILLVLDFSFSKGLPPFPKFLYALPAGFLASSLALILLDNFTYTVLGVGVVTAKNLLRLLYAIGFMSGLVVAVFKFSRQKSEPPDRAIHISGLVSLGILITGILTAGLMYRPLNEEITETLVEDSAMEKPNILLISNDGLNAENLSVYGYERETTPFMEELAQSALLMRNNFANANVSTGSEASLLTGKNPFELRVLYPPNTLQEQDMYEHLPGLLKQAGYRTISLGVPHFVDMNVINFKNAFDSVNCQPNQPHPVLHQASQLGFSNTAYFLTTISERLMARLKHIFFIEEMENPYAELTNNAPIEGPLGEDRVFNCLSEEINQAQQAEQPFFAHIHLVSTHGKVFNPAIRHFSAGQEQNEDWMTDFYDDAILSFDFQIRELVTDLQNQELFEETIFVLYSDHGSQWTIKDRTPLMIRFPGGAHAGEVSESTQNMDIAPTLVDYLDLEKPDWMQGDSLIETLDPARLIYAAEIKFDFFAGGRILPDRIQPPFFQFGKLNVVQCHMFYQIDLQNTSMSVAEIENHHNRCPNSMLASEETVWERTEKMLREFDYEVPQGWGNH